MELHRHSSEDGEYLPLCSQGHGTHAFPDGGCLSVGSCPGDSSEDDKATAPMPFQMEDSCLPDLVRETDVGAYDHEAHQTSSSTTEGGGGGRVG